MRVVAVPQLEDNYGWLLVDEGSGEAAIVDAAEAAPVMAAARREGVRLTTVLATHHHFDHTGGNLALAAALPGLQIIGWAGDRARIPGLTRGVEEGEPIAVGGLRGQALAVPCHTSGHVAYLFGDALFSGDTLFAAGCGRFFEGTAREMYRALYQVLGALPDATRVYCGHEYTVKNLRFARTLEPESAAVAAKLAEAERQVAQGTPTVPTTLGEEKRYNPFLRVRSPELIAHVRAARPEVDAQDPIAVLAAVRALKDDFAG